MTAPGTVRMTALPAARVRRLEGFADLLAEDPLLRIC